MYLLHNALLKGCQRVKIADTAAGQDVDMRGGCQRVLALVAGRVHMIAEHYATAAVSVSTNTLSIFLSLPLGNTKVSEQERF